MLLLITIMLMMSMMILLEIMMVMILILLMMMTMLMIKMVVVMISNESCDEHDINRVFLSVFNFSAGMIVCSKCKDSLSFRVTRDVTEHPNEQEWFSEVAAKSLRQNKIRKTGVQVRKCETESAPLNLMDHLSFHSFPNFLGEG